MKVVVTSDVHLGSKHSRANLFCNFLRRLSAGVDLVLGGDIIDDPRITLEGDHRRALDSLIEQASLRTIHWIHGNHDDAYVPPKTGQILFCTEYGIPNRLYVCHGDHFDNVMPYNGWFLNCFEWLHTLRIKLGAHPVHVAQFAKKFGFLYGFLRKNVARNAIEYALENNHDAIACGHVHYAEDGSSQGVRYVNLGAWTEPPCYCLLVDTESMRLLPVEEAMQDRRFFDAVT